MKKLNHWLLLLMVVLAGCASTEDGNTVRGFDQQRIESLNKSDRFNYDRVIERKPNRVLNFFARVFSAVAKFFNTFLGYMVIIVLIGLLIYTLVKYVNIERQTYENEEVGLRMVNESNVENIDLDKLIREALAREDYRLAIRFSFLNTLKELSLRKLIKMREGKTNFEYYYEIPDEYRSLYRNILSVFEFVWYGEFPADKNLYARQESNIKALELKIKAKDA